MKPSPWWQSWRNVAAFVYLFICVFDIVLMPIFYEMNRPPLERGEIVAMVQHLEPSNQVSAMQIISSEQKWEPLTVKDGSMFHIAFGAILGVAAWSRQSSRLGGRPSYEEPSYGDGPRYGNDDDYRGGRNNYSGVNTGNQGDRI